MRLFSRMLEARQKIEAQCTNYFDYHQYPRLEQWLNVVGIAPGGVKVCLRIGIGHGPLGQKGVRIHFLLHPCGDRLVKLWFIEKACTIVDKAPLSSLSIINQTY